MTIRTILEERHGMKFVIVLITIMSGAHLFAQEHVVPSALSNIFYDADGRVYYRFGEEKYYADTSSPRYTITEMSGRPIGTDSGLVLNFGKMKGSVTYGLIPYSQMAHPLPIFRHTKALKDGKAEINVVKDFNTTFDIVGWRDDKLFTIGYRIIDERGTMMYDGEISVSGDGPFKIEPAIYEGPFVSNVESDKAVIWFKTTMPVTASVNVDGRTFSEGAPTIDHEISLTGLSPGRKYDYTVRYGKFAQQYHFSTAPKPGSRRPFRFAYTSDSRQATGGGERNIYGTNAYVMKKMAAVAMQEGAAFVQFTGDMISGYLSNKEEQHVQYTNWKKSIEPFWHYMPFYVGQGNHEALNLIFRDAQGYYKASVDKFPYGTESAETVLQEAFVNPVNGPESEDGSMYDPDPHRSDFPSYRENVYYYTYDNVAMIVLNSDYWFSPSLSRDTMTSGGLHGYIMDNQLGWLRETIRALENDPNIDHIFVTQHTPAFPNGGHSGDDMWYGGNNRKRPVIAGRGVNKGIIERRDEYLDVLINHSTKVIAVLTGDEHNYHWMKLTDAVQIHPRDYPHTKVTISRPVYQINNGASGAPYYAQEKLPWSEHTRSFSVENAVCIFAVDGKNVSMKVINPDTLNDIDSVRLR